MQSWISRLGLLHVVDFDQQRIYCSGSLVNGPAKREEFHDLGILGVNGGQLVAFQEAILSSIEVHDPPSQSHARAGHVAGDLTWRAKIPAMPTHVHQ